MFLCEWVRVVGWVWVGGGGFSFVLFFFFLLFLFLISFFALFVWAGKIRRKVLHVEPPPNCPRYSQRSKHVCPILAMYKTDIVNRVKF